MKNTASTLDRYLRCVEQFLDYLSMWQCNIADCTWPCVADYLHSAQQSKICDRACHRTPPVMCVKALRWFAKHAQIEGLSTAMYMPLISAYTLRDQPHDRREAMPLPMACVIAFEQCVCDALAPIALRLWLGAALVCIHASIRWGDAQRIEWSSLDLTATALRGICYQTKTAKQGQPWAVHWLGFSGTTAKTSWVVAWLSLLHFYLAKHPHNNPDFLFMHCNITGNPPEHALPSSYHHSLRVLRWACTAPWLAQANQLLQHMEALALTLHSLKSCLLAAAAQRELPKEKRLQQGHHRDSAALYSRDDTIASLGIQRDLRHALHAGWRPQRSMSRGGQAPVPEPPFALNADPQQPHLTAQELRDPALARFVSRHELLQSNADEQDDAALQQLHMPPHTARPTLDLEALEVEEAAMRLLHESSTEEDLASTVASVPSTQESEDEALPEPTALGTGIRNGAWAATHCVTATSWEQYLHENRNMRCLRTACGAPIRSSAFLIQIANATSLCGRAACKRARAASD